MMNTLDKVKAQIELQWDKTPVKTDWIDMEACLRSILRENHVKTINDATTVYLMDEAIAAFTGRGGQLR